MPSSDRDPIAELRHDLCNPINQILGYSELLEEDLADSQPVSIDDLRRIRRAAGEMLALVRARLTPELLKGAEPGAEPEPLAEPQPELETEPGAARSSSDASVRGRSRTGRILVVDDDALNRDLLAQRLTRQGHVVTVAGDGEEALAKLQRQPFDLVLLDVMMPLLDGYGTLAAIKAEERLRSIPVIMISAVDELSSVVRCIEAGAEDYLPKPFNATLLRARVGACLEQKAQHDHELELYQSLLRSQKRLDRELGDAHRHLAAIDPGLREDPRIAPLLQVFQRMAGAVSRRETDLRATLETLEIKISRIAVTTQVGSIVSDPSFSALSERARAMRERRRRSGAAG